MWLLVVAAGSGYLARCLQGSKRPRLFDQGVTRSSGDCDLDLLSEEALKVKDRFEKLDVQQQGDERDSIGSSLFSRSASFQSGIHDAKTSPSKLKNLKTKTWPCWPKRAHRNEPAESDDQARHLFRAGDSSDEYLPSFQEKKEVSCSLPEPETPVRNSESSVHIAGMPHGEASITLRTPLGDVSWQASRQDVESLGDLPSVLDWTSMAASQKFGLDQEGLSTYRSRRKARIRARSRSKESSASATPMQASTTSTTPGLLPSLVRKRKAAPSTLNGFHDSGYLAKEVLLFAMGMHVGVSCMLLYHNSEMEKLMKLRSLNGNTSAARKLLTKFDSIQLDDDNESTTSVVTVENKPIDHMAVLEAELEAELEIMELNLKGDDHGASGNGVSSIASFLVESEGGDASPSESQHWCVSPRDLDRRLHILLEERQAKQIVELETELREVRGKLQVKEAELRSWKNRVYQCTQASLTSPTDDNNDPGETMSCDSPVLVQRPISRKKWFSDDAKPPPVNASLPSLVSEMARCHVSEQDSEETFELSGALERLSLSNRGPVSKSCVSVSDLLQREQRNGGEAGAGGDVRFSRMARRSSLGARVSDDGGHSEAEFQHHMICVKSSPVFSRERINTEVIRTVESKCRIEERFHGSVREEEDKWVSKKFSKPRHSTGNMLASRNRNQRQRRRWFS